MFLKNLENRLRSVTETQLNETQIRFRIKYKLPDAIFSLGQLKEKSIASNQAYIDQDKGFDRIYRCKL